MIDYLKQVLKQITKDKIYITHYIEITNQEKIDAKVFQLKNYYKQMQQVIFNIIALLESGIEF